MDRTDIIVTAADADGGEEYPSCRKLMCFGNREGKCTVLDDTDFGTKPCPFYKTAEESASQQLDALQRLVEQGRFDLIEKYRDVLEGLGILKQEDPFMDEHRDAVKRMRELADLERKLKEEIENFAVTDDGGEVSEWDDDGFPEAGDV